MAIADLTPLNRAREQKAWNWYDWANSAFYTTVLGVLFGPYMVDVAGRAAGCSDPDETCTKTVNVLGLHLAAGSLPSYLVSFATIASAFVLPVIGAMVDRSPRKKLHMAITAWIGSFFCALLFFMKDENWQIGAIAIVVSSVLAGCSLVSYYAILTDVSTESERDAVSSRGWAWGYLGGGVLLALDLVVVLGHDLLGISTSLAVRLSMLSAAVWWAVFTIIPFIGIKNRPPVNTADVRGGLWSRSFGQLWTTVRGLPAYPMTMTFLIAYLFYNDGIQTVIASAAVYGSEQLGFGQGVLIATILLTQFVAFGGALLFGRLARTHGAYRCLLYGTYAWIFIVVGAMFLPRNGLVLFLLAATVIGIVMGGTQALSRSFFSLLIPRGREGEYFALYNAAERGTSWLGMLLFGVMFQLTGSYRPAIVSLVIFFVLGAIFLLRLDPQRGIREAGNALPETLAPAD